MWSVHVVPNNGTSCLALEEQYQTHVMARKKNARRGRGVMPNTFETKLRPFMSVMKISCLVTIFSFRLLFLSISEYTLLI